MFFCNPSVTSFGSNYKTDLLAPVNHSYLMQQTGGLRVGSTDLSSSDRDFLIQICLFEENINFMKCFLNQNNSE